MGDLVNRWEFLGASAAGAGALLLGGKLGSRAVMAGEGGEWPPKMSAVKIYKVYIGRTGGIYLSRPRKKSASSRNTSQTWSVSLGT